ncbi:Dehydrosqualene desaturase [Rubripirellula obstinata]|uniref:Dehydrosqualene desaturase n=1 Tax=Rubripirellula obstinata TaxID=406547 RepID=A0A5B1CK39_9BACT|nr:NAD(P)/FAD-dependent oxidoreductase [Rubripirellula obstinata]KAA1260661.1 Dehydrosqualene desaturase [Rubripirellula obstinata]
MTTVHLDPTTPENEKPTVIIGAGLAGLSCAVDLCKSGHDVTILEASDRVGGRVRTDVVDGFTLDHGFQVLLTAYPACQQLLDYEALRLRKFAPGAMIRQRGRFQVLGDPWRRPGDTIGTLRNPVGTLGDKLRIAKVRRSSRQGTLNDLYQRTDQPTIDYLRQAGFSDSMIRGFFEPFIGGVFLDESLSVSSRMFEFVFRFFAEGDVVVPADGMAAIPRQLAEQLPRGTVRLRQSVTGIDGTTIRLSSGEVIEAEKIVVATESDAASRLLGIKELKTAWNSTINMYYAIESGVKNITAPINQSKMLMLRGDETGPVQTATIISNVAPEYASAGQALLSVSTSVSDESETFGDDDTLDQAVRKQLSDWIGGAAPLRHLANYRVPYGLPLRPLDPVVRSVHASDHSDTLGSKQDSIFLCGDHLETPSIQGAMNSGLRVSQAIRESVPNRVT